MTWGHSRSRPLPSSLEKSVQNPPIVPLLVCKALLRLLEFDLERLGANFGKLCRYVSDFPVATRKRGGAVEVCTAINYACVWYPKRVLCLQRSAVLTCLLRSRGIAAEMVMGAQNLPFKAHAWTEVDGRAVNERRDVQRTYRIWNRC